MDELEQLRERVKEQAATIRSLRSVELVASIRAAGMYVEASRFTMANGEKTPVTFAMTYNNDLMAHMGQESARLFCQFVRDTLDSIEAGASPNT